LGEFSGEVLTGARVISKRLAESGFAFRHAELEPALRDLLA
jgi:NAD dependent epimerase/dehydratase family enzyme